MPRSKRDKKISLTKTAKHGMEWKKKMVTELRESAETYSSIYVFRVVGMTGSGLRQLRKAWRDSRLFLGKNKVMALALGKSPESEVLPNMHKISERLKGECGLLFTDKEEKEVSDFFDKFVEKDYARGGSLATETVKLEEGPLEQFSHSMEPHLRSLGLPTSLKRGVITLIKEYTVCQKGHPLTPEQAKVLKLMEIQMAEFHLVMDSVWSKPDSFKVVISEVEEDNSGDDSGLSEGGEEPEEMETDDDDVEEVSD